MACLLMFIVIISTVFILYQNYENPSGENQEPYAEQQMRLMKMEEEEKERLEKERKARLYSLQNVQLNDQWKIIQTLETGAVNLINRFFSGEGGSYYDTQKQLSIIPVTAQQAIKQLYEINANILNMSAEYVDQRTIIADTEATVIPKLRKLANDFNLFSNKVTGYARCRIMQGNEYGKSDGAFWDSVQRMDRKDAYALLEKYTAALAPVGFDSVKRIWEIDVDDLVKVIWFFAIDKNYSAHEYQNACRQFRRVYKADHIETVIANLYARNRIGGEDALRDPIDDILRNGALAADAESLSYISSSLMWMGAYQAEYKVLQHMLAQGMPMRPKMQERLHTLTNGGGKAPGGFAVESQMGELFFDVSALSWRDEEYIGLFENLAFQDKLLTYSLAVRDETKDLFATQGISIPGMDNILKKIQDVLTEEYGASVKVKITKCVALSGSGEERTEGILVSVDECRQMSILVLVAKIGKKLIIKFYTLFMPTGSDLGKQKQEALSLYKNLSLTVSMWESSLKDMLLMAIQQQLNTMAHESGSGSYGNPVHSDEPVF